MHPCWMSDDELLRGCDVRRLRRSGPGGQHRNKVETAVHLSFREYGIEAEASERRSQAENQRMALRRLRLNLALGVRTAGDRPPSELWQSRVRGGRISVSPAHDDFPRLLAEALDVVLARGGDVKAAAEHLGCTSSQLLKLLKQEPRAWGLVNQRRAAEDRHPLV